MDKKTQTQNNNAWEFLYCLFLVCWIGETQLYNSCGAQRGPSVVLKLVPARPFWDFNDEEQISSYELVKICELSSQFESHQKIAFSPLQTVCEDSRANNTH